MKSGWTGGQYSLFRLLLGVGVGFALAKLLVADGGAIARDGLVALGAGARVALLAFGLVACLALAIGWLDRVAALLLAILWAALLGRLLFGGDPGLALIVFVLLAHACTPSAPFFSWAARGRADPGGGWEMPPMLFVSAWILLTLNYGASGLGRLLDPTWRGGWKLRHEFGFTPPLSTLLIWIVPAVELLFVPLAMRARTRPLAWSALFVVALARLCIGHGFESKVGLVLLHLFAFDPAWLPPRVGAPDRVFYDGTCALCHRLVRFVLAEDRGGNVCTFAPLQGATFARALSQAERAGIPDSVVVLTSDRRVQLRSAAQLRLLDRLGGIWRIASRVLRIVPAPLRDLAYRFVAATRYRVFGREKELCPVVPPELRRRFEE